MPRIHPTATVDASARLAEDVVVGPGCIVEDDVQIAEGCELRPYAIVRRHSELGRGNLVDSFCVLGGLPQDLKFDPAAVTRLVVGDSNVFREGVTISRATRVEKPTRVGSGTYWMAHSHAGHDATVEDNAILTNNALIGGHATLGRRAVLSANAGVHQFTWVGELVMMQGQAGASAHVPPYTIVAGINGLAGLNVVGMRRAPHITDEDRRQVREAFRLLFRSGKSLPNALAEMDAWNDLSPAAQQFRDFVKRAMAAEKPFNRGLCRALRRGRP